MHSAQELLARWPALDTAAKLARLENSFSLSPGPLAYAFRSHEGAAERAATGLWQHDPSVWSHDPAVQEKIANRLGWLTSPLVMADSLTRLQDFARTIKEDRFSDVVLLGMGGSSLAPEVLRAALGVDPGWPRFQMLDSTDPAAVRAVSTPPDRTLYLLASKSGTTIEPNSLAAHFRQRLEDARVPRWADHFVAITDEGTELARRARAERFRELFINPSDIGGRYSALSFFGLVPAALMGQDVAAIVGWGTAMLAASEPQLDGSTANPAVALGLAMGAATRAGRDKLTLILSPQLERFGLWVEQLVAESSGKQGVGVVPIVGEPLGAPGVYGADRLFVAARLAAADPGEADDAALRALGAAGAPVGVIELPEREAVGAEFVRWEIATAVAGALLGVNPFDEPNVQQAKAATQTLLDRFKSERRMPVAPPDGHLAGRVAMTLSAAAREQLQGAGPESLLTLVGPGDYVALLAYLGPDPEMADMLARLRTATRDRTAVATTFAYGPRYLHSTGQLHKGGPNTGVFILITASPSLDLPIPGEAFSFGILEEAQALGDFASLDATGRRALHAHLAEPDPRLLGSLTEALLDRLSRS